MYDLLEKYHCAPDYYPLPDRSSASTSSSDHVASGCESGGVVIQQIEIDTIDKIEDRDRDSTIVVIRSLLNSAANDENASNSNNCNSGVCSSSGGSSSSSSSSTKRVGVSSE